MTALYDTDDLSSFSILHVEDDALQRQLMAHLLSCRAGTYRSAANGEIGLEMFNESHPDLIITDISMPRMNGLDMAAEIRRSSKEIPIIVTTVLDDAELVFDAINLGVNRYVMKPIDTRKLIAAVEDCLEIFHARRRIEKQNQQLQRLIQERDEFLGMAAHDLRNPISAVSGLTELMLMDAPSDDQREILGRIQGQTEFMIRLLNDLLDLKRIEAGHISLNRKLGNLYDVIAEVIREIEPIASRHAISIECHLPQIIEAYYDPDRIRQIIENLLSNALKFTPSGGTITVFATTGERDVEIKVSDTGPGIPQNDLAKIFTRFTTSPDKDGKKGTGLGLAIAQRIATEHGGHLTAANNPTQGASFTLTLPRFSQE